jgi:hypothetical protein
VDLLTVKVLWSKKMEDEEAEKKRLEDLRKQQEEEHRRLSRLVNYSREPKKAVNVDSKKLILVLERADVRISTTKEAPRKQMKPKNLIGALPGEIQEQDDLLSMHKEFV